MVPLFVQSLIVKRAPQLAYVPTRIAAPSFYVTLGTVVKDLAAFRLVLLALADFDADVLVTTGWQNDPSALDPLPGNAVVRGTFLSPKCCPAVRSS